MTHPTTAYELTFENSGDRIPYERHYSTVEDAQSAFNKLFEDASGKPPSVLWAEDRRTPGNWFGVLFVDDFSGNVAWIKRVKR